MSEGWSEDVDPGQTAGGDRGPSQQYGMMASREVAYQQLMANPPPLPAKYSPPLTPEEYKEAEQRYFLRMRETVMQAWDQVYRARVGHIPDADFYAIFQAQEPLWIPGELGQPTPNPWLANLITICRYQAHLDIQRYAGIMARVQREVGAV